MKRCRGCNKELSADHFSYHPKTADNLSHICHSCRKKVYRFKESPNARPGYIYLLSADNGLYKIGIADNLKLRIQGIRNQSPVPLELEKAEYVDAANTLESELHKHFSKFHSHGEWFRLSPNQVDYVKERICHATRQPATGSTISR